MPAFRFVLFAIALFLVLTFAAMLVYPGGRLGDKNSVGYSFTLNFFSDLGRTQAHNGEANWVSSALFTVALGSAGTALGVFFFGFGRFFGARSSVFKGLAWLGTLWGVLSALCFVGIALTPANLLGPWHHQFVGYAFKTFAIAVSIYAFVVALDGGFPRAASLIFVAFGALLFGYLWLITRGPDIDTLRGLTIQATGQKAIVYASLLCIGAQAILAIRKLKNS